ncbi:MAG: MaoC family dehydratase [Opitutaceae bacterium]
MKKPHKMKAVELSYEDLTGSEEFRTATMPITREMIVAFAAQFDPQPFHLDEEAGKKSIFGGLAASGWMTAALTMRLVLEGEPRFTGGAIGLGIDSIAWPRPVRPGDHLSAVSTIVSKRLSQSKPDYGIVKLRTTATNQHAEVVQVMVASILVHRRGTASGKKGG